MNRTSFYEVHYYSLSSKEAKKINLHIEKGNFIYNAIINYMASETYMNWISKKTINTVFFTRENYSEKIVKEFFTRNNLCKPLKMNIDDIDFADYNSLVQTIFGKFIYKNCHIISIIEK